VTGPPTLARPWRAWEWYRRAGPTAPRRGRIGPRTRTPCADMVRARVRAPAVRT
jgi:hypothetical protein